MSKQHEVYIGTYTEAIKFGTGEVLQGKGEGIHFAQFDGCSGGLDIKGATSSVNPSYLAFSKNRRYLYCVNETKTFQGQQGGSVSAFAVDGSGQLRYLSTQPTKGEDPCHISVDSTGKFVFAANFMTGSICMFPVGDGGGVLPASVFHQHEGKGACALRQTGPHAHQVVLTPGEKFVLVPDLGIDQIKVYSFDKGAGTLASHGTLELQPGDGPRHLVFHPCRPDIFYAINELSLQVAVFSFDFQAGTAQHIQSVAICQPINKDSIGAAIQVTQNGRFLYASVRGNDIIASYQVDSQTGLLSLPQVVPCGGKTPRSFAICPEDKFIVCGNQDSHNIAIFKIDQKTGVLTQISEQFAPTPVCIKFI